MLLTGVAGHTQPNGPRHGAHGLPNTAPVPIPGPRSTAAHMQHLKLERRLRDEDELQRGVRE